MARLNIKKIFNPNNAYLLVLIYSSVLLSLIIILALMMRPVADDYAYFSDPNIHNPFTFAFHYYMDWTGRSGQAFWVAVLYKAFGNQVVIYGAILQQILLVLASIFLVYSIFYKKSISHIKLVSFALMISVMCSFMTPSVFDSNLWITSSTVYIGSLIAAFIAAGTAISFVRKKAVKKWHYILLFFITFVAQLFSEPTSLIMIYVSLVCIALASMLYHNRKTLYVSIICFTASVLGFLYMLLSPGTRTRQGTLQVHTSLLDIFTQAFGDLSKLAYIFTSYRIAIIIILCLFVALFFARISKKNTIIIASVAFISSIAIPYSLFISTRYTMGSYSPLRAFTVPVGLAGVLIAIATGVIIAYWLNKVSPRFKRLAVVALFVLLPISLFTAIHQEIPTIRAVAIRSDLYDARESSIHEQITRNNGSIHFEPLPILLVKSDAVDFYYNRIAPAWFEQGFRRYYGIPDNTKIIYEQQPNGYCSSTNNPGWLGAKDCFEMQKEE